jgi:type IV pilus assembly protein PilV
MLKAMVRSHTRGFTLLEVLIALLVFSLGLLGMAGLLIVSVKTTHSAYLRTQASFLAQSMADRMRANMPRIWTGDYNTDYPTGDTDPCDAGATCTRPAVATRDKAIWSTQLSDLLPNAAAVIDCVPSGTVAITGDEAANGAPYTGLCSLQITWVEANLNRDQSGTDTAPVSQTFAWVFQP